MLTKLENTHKLPNTRKKISGVKRIVNSTHKYFKSDTMNKTPNRSFRTTSAEAKKVEKHAILLSVKLDRIVRPSHIYRTLFATYLADTAEEIARGNITPAILNDRQKAAQDKQIRLSEEEWQRGDELAIQLTVKLKKIIRISQLFRACLENYLDDTVQDMTHSLPPE